MSVNLSQVESLWNQAPIVRLHCDAYNLSYMGVDEANLRGGLGWCNCKNQAPVKLDIFPKSVFNLCFHQISYGKLLVMGCTFLDYVNLMMGILPFDKQVTFKLNLKVYQLYKLIEFQKVWVLSEAVKVYPYKRMRCVFTTIERDMKYVSTIFECHCKTSNKKVEAGDVLFPLNPFSSAPFNKICQHSLAVRMRTHPETWYKYIVDLRF